MHKIQRVLLKRLLDRNNQRFSNLTRGYSYEENVVFHLNQLLAKGLIRKNQSGYSITVKGVKIITNLDLTLLKDTGFKALFVGFLCKYTNKYSIKEHPQAGANFYNLPSGKPRFGEKTEKALIRIFKENTGLKINPRNFKFLSLHLKTVKTKKGEALFDDAFTIYEVNIDSKQKSKMKLHRHIKWLSEEEIKYLANRWPEIDILILKKDYSVYKTYEFVSNYML